MPSMGSSSSWSIWRWASATVNAGLFSSSSFTSEVSAEERMVMSLPVTVASVSDTLAFTSRLAPMASRVRPSTFTSPPVLPLSAWASRRLPALSSTLDARSVRSPESPCEASVAWLPVVGLAMSRVEMVMLSPTVILSLAMRVKSAPSVCWLAETTSMLLGSISTAPRLPRVALALSAPPSSLTVSVAENSMWPPSPEISPPRADSSPPVASVAVSSAQTRILPPSEFAP